MFLLRLMHTLENVSKPFVLRAVISNRAALCGLTGFRGNEVQTMIFSRYADAAAGY